MTRPRHRRAAAVLCSALLGGTTAACASTGARPDPSVAAVFPTGPLPTTVGTADGNWATVPMGRLGDPLNTFWQLVNDGTTGTWHDDVEATATATNGGLALGSVGRTVVVGVRPFDRLTFSPLVATTDGGSSWTSGLLPAGLAPVTDALAVAGDGRALALVRHRSQDQVLSSAGSWSDWQVAVTARALDTGAGRACRPRQLTAVGFVGATAVVGARCRSAGAAPLFLVAGGRAVPVDAPAPGTTAAVVGLRPAGGGLDALVELAHGSTASLVVADSANGRDWTTSAALPMGRAHLVSFASSEDGAMAVELAEPGGRLAAALQTPAAGWQPIPAPPVGTATIALTPANTPAALSADSTRLTVWDPTGGAAGWASRQVLHIPIQFGSSD